MSFLIPFEINHKNSPVKLAMPNIRPAAVAGMFYPKEASVLVQDLVVMLAAAVSPELIPKVLIVPHAGYVYSGAVAASAYAVLKKIAPQIRRVVLLGPTHRVAIRGLALPGSDAFATPLGSLSVDAEAVRLISHLPQVVVSPEAHAEEHSLEVQLPFLQTVLKDFKLLPLAVGMASPEQVAEVLELLWGGDETLIVISSDLSHFLPYDTARRVDNTTVQSILGLTGGIVHEQACGATPINGMLRVAKKLQLTAHLLDLRNSGDTAGKKDSVVGYASFAFTDREQKSATEKGALMLQIARSAILRALNGNNTPEMTLQSFDENATWLVELGACFITLTEQGNLRGCIGSLLAHRPLFDDIKGNAVSSALQDTRFKPLTAAELDRTKIEISLLTTPESMNFASQSDALAKLRPYHDGVIFQYGSYRSTFLPQVWEQLPQPQQFMAHLKQKAGLPGDFWSPEVKLFRYSVEKFKE